MGEQASVEPGIARCYLDAQQRLDELVRPLDDTALATPAPACPGWTVRDILGHLVGTVEWVAAGRLRGIPTEDDTAEQVAEQRGVPTSELLDRWSAAAAGFAAMVEAAGIWPAAVDAVTHEQDIRGALGMPGARDAASTRRVAGVLLSGVRPSLPIQVETDSRTAVCGEGEPELRLRTTDFEVLRWRMGRRSRRQMAAMDWSGDPAPVLDELHVFGPAEEDVIE